MIRQSIGLRSLVWLFVPGLAMLANAALVRAADQTATWDGSADNWSDPSHWNTLLFPNNGNGGFTYDAIIGSGAVTVDQNITIELLTLSGGTLADSAGRLSGDLVWSGGTLADGTTLGAGLTTTVAGIPNNFSNGFSGSVTNAGTMVWQQGRVYSQSNAATFTNSSLIDLQGNGSSFSDFVGDAIFINNAGSTLRRSVGTGTASINMPVINHGTIQVESGILDLFNGGSSAGVFNVDAGAMFRLASGTFTLEAGSSMSGDGPVRIAGATLNVNGLAHATNLELAGGTLADSAGRLSGTLSWSGGTLADGTTLGSGLTVTVAGIPNNFSNLFSGSVTNAGTMVWQQGIVHSQSNAATFTNSGLVDLQGNGFSFSDYVGDATFINNAGSTLRRSVGTGTASINMPVINHGTIQVKSGTLDLYEGGSSSAVVNVDAGAMFRLASGTFTLETGSSMPGAGPVRIAASATVNVNGIAQVANLELAGGILEDTQGRLSGNLTWSGGTLADGTTLGPGLTTTVAGITNNFSNLFSGSVTNAGTMVWQQGIIHSYSTAATFINSSLIDLQGNGTSFSDFVGDAKFTNNAGSTLRRSVGTGTASIVMPVTNNGAIEGQSGTLLFHYPVVNNGTISNTAGTISFSHLSNLGLVAANGGTISVGGRVHVSPVSIAVQQEEHHEEIQTHIYTGTSLDSGVWSVDGGTIEFQSPDNAPIIRNRAHMTIAGSGRIGSPSSESRLISNEGTLVVGAGFLSLHNSQHSGNNFFEPNLQNSGTLRVLSGGTVGGSTIRSSGYVEGTGSISSLLILEGGTISSTGTLTVNDVRTGVGVSQFTAGTLAGTVTIGTDGSSPPDNRLQTAAGTSINGALLFSRGELEIDGTLNVQSIGMRGDSGNFGTILIPNYWARYGEGTIVAGTLNVANQIQFPTSGLLRVDSTATMLAPAGIKGGGFGGTGVIRGNVSSLSPDVSFSSTGTLTLDGNMAFSSGAVGVNGGALLVTGDSSVADGSTLTLSQGGALHTSNGLSLSGSTLAGNGDVFGNVTATNTQFAPNGTLRLRDSLTMNGSNTISGSTLRVDGTTTLNGGSLTVTGDSRLQLAAGTQLAGHLAINADLELDNPLTVQSLTANGKLSGAKLTVVDQVTSIGYLELATDAQLHFQSGLDNATFAGYGQLLGNLNGAGTLNFVQNPTSSTKNSNTVTDGLVRTGGVVNINEAAPIVNGGMMLTGGTILNMSSNPGRGFGGLTSPDGLTLNNAAVRGEGIFIGDLTAIGVSFAMSEIVNGVVGPGFFRVEDGDLTFAGGTSVVSQGILDVYHGDTVLDGGNLRIDAGTKLTGHGSLVIKNGQLELAGTLEVPVRVNGQFVVGGVSSEGLTLDGANISTQGDGAEFDSLESFNNSFLESGTLDINGAIVVNTGALIFGAGTSVHATEELLVKYGAEFISKGSMTTNGVATFSGTVLLDTSSTLEASAVNVGPGSKTTVKGHAKSENQAIVTGQLAVNNNGLFDGDLAVSSPSPNEPPSGLLGAGLVAGNAIVGNVAVQTAGGTGSGLAEGAGGDLTGKTIIAPGDTTGVLTIQNATFLNDVVLQIEVRDAAGLSGVDYDRLDVPETLAFDIEPGNLTRIDLISLGANDESGLAANFDKHDSYSWTIVSAGNIAGFDAAAFMIDASSFLNSVYGTFSIEQQLNELKLLYTPAPPLAGDYNENGVVDAADYVVWRKNPGSFPADAYATWRAHFDQTPGSGSAAIAGSSSGAVPEPASLALLLFAATGWCLRRGRAT